MTLLKGIIILGTSRSEGNTSKAVRALADRTGYPIIDLNTKQISYYDYESKNRDDDFLPLVRDIVTNYDLIVFSSPVYWYTMSAQLKTFFDRLSDVIRIEKDTGRKLRGKFMATLSSSESDDVPACYYEPFTLSADYLGMKYLGSTHAYVEDGEIPPLVEQRLDNFVEKLHSK